MGDPRSGLLRIEPSTSPRRYLLIGEIDMSNADQLRAFLGERAAEGGPLVLDLSRMTFLDSSAINAIVAGSKLFDGADPLQLVELSAQARRVLDVALPVELPSLRIERT